MNRNFLRKFLVVIFCALSIGAVVCVGDTFADNGGWIDNNPHSPQFPGGGGSGCPYYGACNGYSWIFYKSSGLVTGAIKFRPDDWLDGNNARSYDIEIPAECSEHTEQGGGFWHFGSNAYGGGAYDNFGSLGYLYGHSSDQYTYSTLAGSYGHKFTVSYQYGRNNIVPRYNLDHKLYSDGVIMYEAVDSDDGSGAVWEAFRKAYKYTYGVEYENSSDYKGEYEYPDNISAFCYWEGMEKGYYGQSWVGNGDVESSTGEVDVKNTSNPGAKIISKRVTIPTGANSITVSGLTFMHNVYASFRDNEASQWRIDRIFDKNGVTISGGDMSSSVSRSTTIANELSSSRYQANSAGNILRDNYSLTFKKIGTFTFCEELSKVGVGRVTRVCAIYYVSKGTPPPSDNLCTQWTPSSYTSSSATSGTTSVVSKVLNATLGTDYADSVYAKPTDNINWVHCYYPGVQKVADSEATKTHGSESNTLAAGSTTANTNVLMKNLYSWGNSFSVSSSVTKGSNFRNPNSTSIGNYRSGTLTPAIYNGARYTIGVSDIKSLLDETYDVEYGSDKNKAGATLSETNTSSYPVAASVTNHGIHTWKCAYYCACDCGGCKDIKDEDGKVTGQAPAECCTHGSCSHSNDYITHSCSGTASSHADVLVPYNFINTATIQLSSSIVYAGETATIGSAYAEVRTRTNNTLQGTYATQVDDARVEFVAYLSSDSGGSAIVGVKGGKDYDICSALGNWEACTKLADRDTTLNNNGALGLGSSQNTRVATDSLTALMGSTYNVYDATAGKYYCVVAAVYPYTVNGDLDMSASGSNNWYVSAPSCAVIAKKPSLEVWGSGLYTAGKIFTASAEKRVVNGFVNFTPQSSIDTTVFGSWVETNIIANGQVAGLASGAATGFPGSTTRTLTSGSNKLSGSKEGSTRRFCTYRSPLTMPNSGCITSTGGLPGVNTGAVGSSNAGMNKPVDRDALISRFMTNDGTFKYNNTYTRLSQLVSELGSNTIPAGQNQTYVIDAANNDAANKTFTIDTNIQYAEVYNNFVDIPKLIIRADNININCNVTRIDAVLIADKLQSGSIAGNIDTCANANDNDDRYSNDGQRSVQLKINGAVIAGSMTAGRTYGAGTGAYSVIPAEIVDYDTSLYLWGSPRADAGGSGKLETVYVQELSPRL